MCHLRICKHAKMQELSLSHLNSFIALNKLYPFSLNALLDCKPHSEFVFKNLPVALIKVVQSIKLKLWQDVRHRALKND